MNVTRTADDREPPRYRTSDEMTYLNGCPYPAGSAVTYTGWPRSEWRLEPINATAKILFDYYKQRSIDPFFPSRPIDDRTGRFYLPGLLHSVPGRGHPPALPLGAAHTDMPRYRAETEATFGGIKIERGEEFVFLGWPNNRMSVEPVNEAAGKVIAYVKTCGAHPELPPSPWNLFDDSLWLPELPEQKRPALPRDVR